MPGYVLSGCSDAPREYPGGISNQLAYWLDGRVLLSVHGCSLASCDGNSVTGAVAAYDIGSWPS